MRSLALAALALVLAACVCVLAASSRGGRNSSELLELGAEPSEDLRKALALEVSKKRYNKAKKRLERLHEKMKADFDGLKKWTVEKDKARADLEATIAEYDPSVEIDASNTAEFRSPPQDGGNRSTLHALSTTKHARVLRATKGAPRVPANAVARVSAPVPSRPAAAAPLPTANSAKPHKTISEDAAVQKSDSEMREMEQQQAETEREVAALAQQMKSMMASQGKLNAQMVQAATQMGGRAGGTMRMAPQHKVVREDDALVAASVPHKVISDDNEVRLFNEGEAKNIHSILTRELAKLNLDQPKPPQTAVSPWGKRAHTQMRVRHEMEAAVLSAKRLDATL